MKKIILILGVVSFTALSFVSCNSDDDNNNSSIPSVNIDPEGLPVSAKSMISTYFSDTTIKNAKQYSIPTIRNSEYSALLNNGFEIDFDRNGNWTEVESEHNQAIPESFLSKEVPNIYNYVKTNYPSNWITSVEKEHYGYSVELNSGIDLIFNQNQEFVGIDLDDDDEQEEIILPASLPQAAKDFVSTHFTNAQYVLAKKETERNTVTYKAYLSTGYKLEFDATGNWTEVESKGNGAIPSAIILTPIQTYVSANYQAYRIIGIEKEVYGYSIEIIKDLRDIDLKFNANGDFLGIDD